MDFDYNATKGISQSVTLWGVLLTSLTAVLPAVGQATGVDLSAVDLTGVSQETTNLVNSVGALAGVVLTVWGRLRATKQIKVGG